MADKKVSRSAKSGEFVSADEAKADPAETVTETVKAAPKRAAKPKPSPVPEAPAKDPSEMDQGELQLFKAAEEAARAKK